MVASHDYGTFKALLTKAEIFVTYNTPIEFHRRETINSNKKNFAGFYYISNPKQMGNGLIHTIIRFNKICHHFPRAFLYCADIAACKFGWESTIFTCCKHGMLT